MAPIVALEPIADTADEAMAILVSRWKPLAIADSLCVNDAHVYKYRKRGYISPTLRKALREKGFTPPRPKRYRLHYEGGRGATGRRRVERVRKFYVAAGYDNLTDWIDSLVEVE